MWCRAIKKIPNTCSSFSTRGSKSWPGSLVEGQKTPLVAAPPPLHHFWKCSKWSKSLFFSPSGLVSYMPMICSGKTINQQHHWSPLLYLRYVQSYWNISVPRMRYSIFCSERAEEILVNAPASFDKGRPGAGGHHGGGHHGGGHGGGNRGCLFFPKIDFFLTWPGWNCCLFAKAYCKLPCHGKLCKENYSLARYWSLSYPGSILNTERWMMQAHRPALSSASPLAGWPATQSLARLP